MAPKVESARTTEPESVRPVEVQRIGAPVVVEMFDIPRGNREIEQQIAKMAFDVL